MLKLYLSVALIHLLAFVLPFSDAKAERNAHAPPLGCESLPIHLLSFNAWTANGIIVLEWETNANIETKAFDIQRSSDGENFEDLFKIEAKGSSKAIQYYLYHDNTPLKGKNYYRLKLTKIDGSCNYSQSTLVMSESVPLSETSISHPSHIVISKSEHSKNQEQHDFTLYDEIGNQLKVEEILDTPNAWKLSVAHLIQGMYFLKIATSKHVQYERIIVH